MQDDKEYDDLVADLTGLSYEELTELIPTGYELKTYQNESVIFNRYEYVVSLKATHVEYTSSVCDAPKIGLAKILALIMLEFVAKISKPF